MLARIDAYAKLLDPEVPRERERWGGTYESWVNQVEKLRKFLRDGHIDKMIAALDRFIGLTPQEEETYFGRWLD